MHFSFIFVRRECVCIHMQHQPKATGVSCLYSFIHSELRKTEEMLTVIINHEQDTCMLHKVFILSSFMDFIIGVTYHSCDDNSEEERVLNLNQFEKLLLLPLAPTISASNNEAIQQ